MLNYKNKRDGFTLIEVMMGMFVITILMMSIIASLPQISLIILKSATVKGANTIGNNKIEYFRTLPFDNIKSELLPKSPITETITLSGNTYKTTTTISNVSIAGVSGNALEVNVTVHWQPQQIKGPNLEATYNTLFTKNGLSDKQFIEAY